MTALSSLRILRTTFDATRPPLSHLRKLTDRFQPWSER